MAGADKGERHLAALKRAAQLTAEALDILDAQGAVPDITAHLDLALQLLREELTSPD